MKKLMMACLVTVMANSAAHSQGVYYWPSPENSSAAKSVRAVLPVGTPIMMRTRTQISTKDNTPGDRVYLEVAENVTVGDQIVIPAGAPVVAEVAATQRNGHFGKKGKIEIRLIEVQTPSGPVRLLGSSNDEGISGTVASFATILLVSPLGFLIHGTSAQIPAGTPVQGHLGADLKYSYHGSQVGQQSAQLDGPTRGTAPFNY